MNKISEGRFKGSPKENVHSNATENTFSCLTSEAQAVKEKHGFYLN